MGVVTGKGSLFIDGAEVGPTVTIDSAGYTEIPMNLPTEISMSGVWYGGIDLARGSDKTVFHWDVVAAKLEKHLRELDELDKEKAISKQIGKLSYRKTKSQRRRRS